MNVTDLDGKIHKLSLVGQVKTNNKSSLHLECRKLLQELYSTYQVIEELLIPVNSKTNLYLDFFIPLLKLGIEVHGSQHYEQSSFFHKDKWAFAKQQQNDRLKREFCQINNIELKELAYNERDNWRNLISQG